MITNPVTRASRRYMLEFTLAMIAYVATITVSRVLLEGPLAHVSYSLQVALAASPVLPVAWLFAATVRLIRHTDELKRRMIVDSLAIAGGVTALLAITYGLIESDRFPHLSAWWTWTVYGLAGGVAGVLVPRYYR